MRVKPEDTPGSAGSQRLGVVDRVAACESGHDERQELVAGVRRAGLAPEVEVAVDQLAQAEAVSQGGRQKQSRVGHQAVVVEGRREPVEAVG